MDARGKVTVNTIADKSGSITFGLLQNSDWNSFLRSKLDLNQSVGLSGNAATFLPMQVMISDKMGGTKVTGVNGWIAAHPPIVRGSGINTLQWTLEFEQILFVEGKTDEVS